MSSTFGKVGFGMALFGWVIGRRLPPEPDFSYHAALALAIPVR
jgi:hypothetical protein